MELTPLQPPQTDDHSVIVPPPLFSTPSAKQQSWGTIISILIIVGMIVVGAFYAWGKRIAETRDTATDTSTSTQSY